MPGRPIDYRGATVEGLWVEEVSGALTISFSLRELRRIWRRNLLMAVATAAVLTLGFWGLLRQNGSIDRGMGVMLWLVLASTALVGCAWRCTVAGRRAVVVLTRSDLWLTWPDRHGDLRRVHVPRWAVRDVRYEAGEGAVVVRALGDGDGPRAVLGGEDPGVLEQVAELLRQEMGLKRERES